MSERSILVVGAGITGLICARRLKQMGMQVRVFEKSRGFGGRVATRRISVTTQAGSVSHMPVDHGTQYVSPKSEAFQAQLQELQQADIVTEWARSRHVLDENGLHSDDKYAPRYIGLAGMAAIAKHLAAELDVVTETRVTRIHRQPNSWVIRTEGNREESSAGVVIAVPAPQALEILKSATNAGEIAASDSAIGALQAARYAPCLAVMAGYAETTPKPAWQGVQWLGHDAIAWTALDSSKRNASTFPAIVLHSTADFARQYLDATHADLEAAGRHLLYLASQELGAWLAEPDWLQVHRWRYAFPETTASELSFAISTAETRAPLVLAGDWCASPRVEGAFLSGLDAAVRLAKTLA
ncbi:MAG: FAD-dependent oxidoreductase [Cyanobacteria bacterium P01_E01_bin.48]